MRTIIAGSRGIVEMGKLKEALNECGWIPTTVISGAARGVDKLGERYAQENNIPLEKFPADWDKFGRAAGMIRNKQMANSAEALIALWDGKSRGTLNMIVVATEMKLKIFVKVLTST